jgi:creatinine amidohydrolase
LTPLTLSVSEAESKENGVLDIHAGAEETSRLVFSRPDLVNPLYRTLPPFTANNSAELFRPGKTPNWPGYIGSPRLATDSYGARLQQYRSERDNALALAILDRLLDEREIPRYAKIMLGDKTLAKELKGASKYDGDIGQKQREWMKKKGIE